MIPLILIKDYFIQLTSISNISFEYFNLYNNVCSKYGTF